MAETYTYSVATQTSVPAGPPENGLINGAQLLKEIQDSSMTQAARDDYIGAGQTGVGQDVLKLTFANAISGADETLLDAVVLAHVGTVTTENPKRIRMVPFDTPLTQGDATYTTKLTLTCLPIKKGTWGLKVRGELKLTVGADFTGPTLDRAADMRLLIDGVERANWVNAYEDWHNMSAADDLDIEEADAPVFEIQIRRRGTSTAELRRAVISMVFIGGQED